LPGLAITLGTGYRFARPIPSSPDTVRSGSTISPAQEGFPNAELLISPTTYLRKPLSFPPWCCFMSQKEQGSAHAAPKHKITLRLRPINCRNKLLPISLLLVSFLHCAYPEASVITQPTRMPSPLSNIVQWKISNIQPHQKQHWRTLLFLFLKSVFLAFDITLTLWLTPSFLPPWKRGCIQCTIRGISSTCCVMTPERVCITCDSKGRHCTWKSSKLNSFPFPLFGMI
jgi:hypothetical protein